MCVLYYKDQFVVCITCIMFNLESGQMLFQSSLLTLVIYIFCQLKNTLFDLYCQAGHSVALDEGEADEEGDDGSPSIGERRGVFRLCMSE